MAEGSGGETEAPQLKKNKEGREEREGAGRGSKAALSALVKRPVKGKAGDLQLECPYSAYKSSTVLAFIFVELRIRLQFCRCKGIC